ncbi:hypothetical protein [Paracoccus sp. (in: a-proteobacteria)]|uniref:hypothetical protein n=1 Tax=Paracoccus sp. TaxID=267 RepID=UPI002AFF329E|nr:hypothetical protein [Paracoccus sp. (in: a-proteobacteria)]
MPTAAGSGVRPSRLPRDMLEDWQELGDELQAAIATVMDGASSYEDVLQRLPEALAHMPTGLAVQTLVKGMFKGRVLGDQRDG